MEIKQFYYICSKQILARTKLINQRSRTKSPMKSPKDQERRYPKVKPKVQERYPQRSKPKIPNWYIFLKIVVIKIKIQFFFNDYFKRTILSKGQEKYQKVKNDINQRLRTKIKNKITNEIAQRSRTKIPEGQTKSSRTISRTKIPKGQ